MLSLSNVISSTDLLLLWHEIARFVAYTLLAGLGLFALYQFAASNKHGLLAKYALKRSLRSSLIVGLTLIGTIPAVALILLLTERSANLRIERMSDRLNETAGSVAHVIDQYIDKHVAGIASAASAISDANDLSNGTVTRTLLLYHAVYSDFLTMLGANADGDIVAATDSMSGPLAPVAELAGHNVADREYFIAPMANGKPYVSNPFRGRSLGSDPIVAISAALFDNEGKRIGIVEGSMNLSAFAAIDRERPHIDGAAMIIVDQANRVVYATEDAGLSALDSIAGSALVATAAANPEQTAFNFEHVDADGSHRYMGAYANTANGWRVLLRAPMKQVTMQMLGDYRIGVLLLFVACVISLLLARAIVRSVTRSVHDMNAAVGRFSVDGSGEEVRTPGNTAVEFHPIFEAMRKRSKSLKKAHARLSKSIDAGESLRRELTQAVARKEVEIAERTAALEEANKKLSSLTKTDALTGIPNRREFDEFERRTWRLSARNKTPVAVILADIDYFKIYNDLLGHQAGDDCLRAVAEALVLCATRPLDLVARYGGEEFVAVLGGSTTSDALVVAERMRQTIEGLNIEHPGSAHGHVTISVGIASTIPTDHEDSESIVKAADESLYNAKAAGRNCVVYRRDEDYATYDPAGIDLGATGVIQILAGKRAS